MQDIKAVFDIWNGYIKWAVFGQDEGKTVLLVKEMVKTKWMRRGKIVDTEDFMNSMNHLIEWFVKKLWGDFIDEICISLSHPEMIITRIIEQKRVMNETIGNDDIEHLNKVVSDIGQKNNYETLKVVPVHRIVDDHKKEKDPLWLQAKKLEIIADVFMIPKNFYGNIIEIFEKLDLNVIDIIPNILSSSEIALDFDLKDLGTLLIDIGHNQTSYVVYEEGYPLTYGVLPVGGENITKDIGIGLEIDIKDAETVKKEKWIIIFDEKIDKDEEVDIHRVSDIIAARYEQIFEQINKELININKDGRLPGGVILTGGGAKMENLEKLAKHIFKLATFYGKDRQLHLGDLSTNIQFLNTLGAYIRSNKYLEGRKSWIQLNFDFLNKAGKFFKNLF